MTLSIYIEFLITNYYIYIHRSIKSIEIGGGSWKLAIISCGPLASTSWYAHWRTICRPVTIPWLLGDAHDPLAAVGLPTGMVHEIVPKVIYIYVCVMCLATVRMFNKLLHSMMVCTKGLPHVGLRKRLLAWEKKGVNTHTNPSIIYKVTTNGHDHHDGTMPYAYILLQKSPWMQKHKHNHRKSDWCHIPFTIFWSWSSIPQSGHCAGDLIQPPATFTESQYYFRSWLPAFQQPTDTFFPKRTTMSCENILVYVYIYIYTCIHTVSICMNGPLWSNIMQNLCIFSQEHFAAWLAPALDGLQYRRQSYFQGRRKVGQNVVSKWKFLLRGEKKRCKKSNFHLGYGCKVLKSLSFCSSGNPYETSAPNPNYGRNWLKEQGKPAAVQQKKCLLP